MLDWNKISIKDKESRRSFWSYIKAIDPFYILLGALLTVIFLTIAVAAVGIAERIKNPHSGYKVIIFPAKACKSDIFNIE